MSKRSSRREGSRDQDFKAFERAGEASESASNGTLPRAQERVQQALERDSLDFDGGYGGYAPMSASSVALGVARHGLRPSRSLAERLSRPQQFRVLARLQVRVPSRVFFCQQRQVRREVLFAKQRAGYGGSAKKKHWRRTQNSQYRC